MEDTIIAQRKAKAKALSENQLSPYANDFKVNAVAQELHNSYAEYTDEMFSENPVLVSIAGRVRAIRKFGKVAFVAIDDQTGRMQATIFVKKLGESSVQ